MNLPLALLLMVMPMPGNAVEGSAAWCEQRWQTESAGLKLSDPAARAALLGRWESYREKCSGTVVYEARLAIACALAGHSDRAAAVLRALRGSGAAHRPLLEFAALQINYLRMFTLGKARIADARGLEAEFSAFLSRYPEHLEAHLMLGGVQTLLGKHVEAIRSLDRGLRSAMDVSGGYRNLAISYTALGRYREGREAAERALRMNEAFADDQWFVYAQARADAALGEFKAAEAALLAIGKKDGVMRDPEFKEAVNFVMARFAEYKAGKGTAR